MSYAVSISNNAPKGLDMPIWLSHIPGPLATNFDANEHQQRVSESINA